MSLAGAFRAGVGNRLARPAAVPASAGDHEKALLIPNLTLAPTGDTWLFGGSRSGSKSTAIRAIFRARDADSRFRASNRVFEADLEVVS